MKTISLIHAPDKRPPALSIVLLSVALISLIGCQKEPEAEPVVEDTTQSVAVNTVDNDNDTEMTSLDTEASIDNAATSERDIDLSALEDDLDSTNPAIESQAVAPNPQQAITGKQITDVEYRSSTGETLYVVFETSATGVLNAIVTLPNQPKMTLSAPEGQGNNPTYRSKDGSVELVSHQGGTTIDLMRNGSLTSFDMVSADAEVVTES